MKQNKVTGFWIRLCSRLIDMLIFAVLSITLAYFLTSQRNNHLQFSEPWMFYCWNLVSICLLLALFVLCPLYLSGQTPGMALLHIKIIFTKKKKQLQSLCKRELFFSLAWVFNLFVLLIVINHSLISKILIDQKKVEYSTWESMRIALFTTLGSIVFFVQWIFAFSVMIRKNKLGFHDRISKTTIVYKHKFEMIVKPKQITSFKPFMIKNTNVEWLDQ